LAVWSVVNFSKLTSDLRIDSEYYQPEYLFQEEKISCLSPRKLERLAKISDGNHLSISDQFLEDENEGVRYLRGQDLTDFFIADSNPVYIPNKAYEELGRSHIYQGDILLSIVGTVGNVGLVTDKYSCLTGSCKIAIIRPHSINPYILAAYLASDIGKAQIDRRVRGAVQQGLILPDLKEFPIPNISEEQATEIEKLIRKSRDCQKKSESLYAEAEALLLHELGLDTLDLSTQKTYVANFSETVEGDRFDAEYFQPKYAQLLEILSAAGQKKGWTVEKLGHLSKKLKYGTSANLDYLDEGIPFLRIADLTKFRFDKNSLKYISVDAAKSEDHSSVMTDDVLVSRSGTLGLSIVVTEELNGAIFGSYFIRTRPNKKVLNPIYLSLYLNSLAGKMQFERSSTGAIQTNLTIPVIESTLIVAPSLDAQNVIAQEVLRSIQAEDESKALLEQAKQNIEEMILG
jgi:restriction endonuclease S subunit